MISNKQNQIIHRREEGRKVTNTISFNQPKNKRTPELVPKSINQESYILALSDPGIDVVVVSGPAGTGKTYLAVLSAITALRSGQVDRIILSRPAVSVDDEKHGFLPGDLNAKMEPWTKPLLDVLREYYSLREITDMIADGVIEISPLAFMRGRTFKNSWIILDEAQNATPSQLKMLLTRIGKDSKIIITGDIEQGDRKNPDNGLLDLKTRLEKKGIKGIELCKFDLSDVQRHRLIEHVIKLYQ
jgi:phosphate starvation-inducible PhoH-like protein